MFAKLSISILQVDYRDSLLVREYHGNSMSTRNRLYNVILLQKRRLEMHEQDWRQWKNAEVERLTH
jgi:hypothetical protein